MIHMTSCTQQVLAVVVHEVPDVVKELLSRRGVGRGTSVTLAARSLVITYLAVSDSNTNLMMSGHQLPLTFDELS